MTGGDHTTPATPGDRPRNPASATATPLAMTKTPAAKKNRPVRRSAVTRRDGLPVKTRGQRADAETGGSTPRGTTRWCRRSGIVAMLARHVLQRGEASAAPLAQRADERRSGSRATKCSCGNSRLREPQLRTTPAMRLRGLVPVRAVEPRITLPDRPPACQRIEAPEQAAVDRDAWASPKRPSASARGCVVLQRLLDRFAVRIALRRERGAQGLEARRVVRVRACRATRGGTHALHCQRFGVPPSPAQPQQAQQRERLKGAGPAWRSEC